MNYNDLSDSKKSRFYSVHYFDSFMDLFLEYLLLFSGENLFLQFVSFLSFDISSYLTALNYRKNLYNFGEIFRSFFDTPPILFMLLCVDIGDCNWTSKFERRQ